MKDKEKEEMLLTGASLDELIKMKIEQEFLSDMNAAKNEYRPKIYTNIKDVPQDKIFAKNTTYKYFNRNTKTETYINGIQAEALIGIQNNIREKMLKGELNAFTTDDAYIKFDNAEF